MGKEMLEAFNDLSTNAEDSPFQRVTITKCGACNSKVGPRARPAQRCAAAQADNELATLSQAGVAVQCTSGQAPCHATPLVGIMSP